MFRNPCKKTLYTLLHARGEAHSVEVWNDNVLVGGLYGVTQGRAFFGESMFSKETNASKLALIHLVEHLKRRDFILLDTQFLTDHLKSIDLSFEFAQKSLMKHFTSLLLAFTALTACQPAQP